MGIRLILLSCLFLQGCVTFIASNMGAGATAISTAETVDAAKTAADVASVTTTHKTLTDHAISYVVGKDCRMLNVLEKKAFCRVHYTYYPPNRGGVAFYWITPPEPVLETPKAVIKPKIKVKPKLKQHQHHRRVSVKL